MGSLYLSPGSASEKVTGIENGGTDWQGALFRRNAVVQSHDIAFGSGNGKTTCRVSLNYFDQDGIVRDTSFKRYSARFSLNSRISDCVRRDLYPRHWPGRPQL